MVSKPVPRGGSILVGLLGAIYGAYLGRILSRFELLLSISLPRLGIPCRREESSNTH